MMIGMRKGLAADHSLHLLLHKSTHQRVPTDSSITSCISVVLFSAQIPPMELIDEEEFAY